tara:strand:+ start:1412 stop:1681 length:270 start_codon:yes stop_codon:yes gene_type:complete
MTKKAKEEPQYTKTLIRTVSHYNEDESESLLNIQTNVFRHPDEQYNYEHLSVQDPSGEYQYVFIHSEAQAIELFRAIKAAGKELGWFDD